LVVIHIVAWLEMLVPISNMGALRNESCLVIYEGLIEALADPGFQRVGEFGEKEVISVGEIDIANRT
jgi:hypothetical protein